MSGDRAPAPRPPTGRTEIDVQSDSLLDALRRGERDAFVRYFELYRVPVYTLVWHLLRDDAQAVAATDEVFETVYRRILLHEGPVDLRAWTFKSAIDVCEARRVEAGPRIAAAPVAATTEEPGDLGVRFTQALGALAFRHQAALLLHDLDGLGPAELAVVFGLTEDAARALQFRAREDFRRAFGDLSAHGRVGDCGLAEATAAGAVGRGLSEDEARRLDEHAGYCRDCRRAMKAWGAGAIGLGMFLSRPSLPEPLATAPVFGSPIPLASAPGAAATSGATAGALVGALAFVARALTSKAAAYVLAAACLALAVGLVVYQSGGDRAVVMFLAPGARGPHLVDRRAVVAPTLPAPIAGSSQARTTSTRTTTPMSAPVASTAGAAQPTILAAAAVAPAPRGVRTVAGGAATGGTAAPAASPKDAKAAAKAAKATAKARDSVKPGRSAAGNSGQAKPAKARPVKPAKKPKQSAKPQAKQPKKPKQNNANQPDRPQKSRKSR